MKVCGCSTWKSKLRTCRRTRSQSRMLVRISWYAGPSSSDFQISRLASSPWYLLRMSALLHRGNAGRTAESLWRDRAGAVLAKRVRLAFGFGVHIQLVPCPDEFSQGFAALLGLARDEEAGGTDKLSKTRHTSSYQTTRAESSLSQKLRFKNLVRITLKFFCLASD